MSSVQQLAPPPLSSGQPLSKQPLPSKSALTAARTACTAKSYLAVLVPSRLAGCLALPPSHQPPLCKRAKLTLTSTSLFCPPSNRPSRLLEAQRSPRCPPCTLPLVPATAEVPDACIEFEIVVITVYANTSFPLYPSRPIGFAGRAGVRGVRKEGKHVGTARSSCSIPRPKLRADKLASGNGSMLSRGGWGG